jgi:hypothetical protein
LLRYFPEQKNSAIPRFGIFLEHMKRVKPHGIRQLPVLKTRREGTPVFYCVLLPGPGLIGDPADAPRDILDEYRNADRR